MPTPSQTTSHTPGNVSTTENTGRDVIGMLKYTNNISESNQKIVNSNIVFLDHTASSIEDFIGAAIKLATDPQADYLTSLKSYLSQIQQQRNKLASTDNATSLSIRWYKVNSPIQSSNLNEIFIDAQKKLTEKEEILKEISAVKDTISKLLTELLTLLNNNQFLVQEQNKEFNKLRNDFISLQTRLNTADQLIIARDQEIIELKEANQTLKTQLDNVQAALDAKEQKMREAQKNAYDAAQEIINLKTDEVQLRKDLEKANSAAQQSGKKDAEIVDLRTEIATLGNKIRELEANSLAISEEKARQSEEIKKLMADLLTANETLHNAQAAEAAAKSQLQNSQALLTENHAATTRITSLEGEVENVTTAKTALELRNADLQLKLNSLEEQNATLQEEIKRLNASLRIEHEETPAPAFETINDEDKKKLDAALEAGKKAITEGIRTAISVTTKMGGKTDSSQSSEEQTPTLPEPGEMYQNSTEEMLNTRLSQILHKLQALEEPNADLAALEVVNQFHEELSNISARQKDILARENDALKTQKAVLKTAQQDLEAKFAAMLLTNKTLADGRLKLEQEQALLEQAKADFALRQQQGATQEDTAELSTNPSTPTRQFFGNMPQPVRSEFGGGGQGGVTLINNIYPPYPPHAPTYTAPVQPSTHAAPQQLQKDDDFDKKFAELTTKQEQLSAQLNALKEQNKAKKDAQKGREAAIEAEKGKTKLLKEKLLKLKKTTQEQPKTTTTTDHLAQEKFNRMAQTVFGAELTDNHRPETNENYEETLERFIAKNQEARRAKNTADNNHSDKGAQEKIFKSLPEEKEAIRTKNKDAILRQINVGLSKIEKAQANVSNLEVKYLLAFFDAFGDQNLQQTKNTRKCSRMIRANNTEEEMQEPKKILFSYFEKMRTDGLNFSGENIKNIKDLRTKIAAEISAELSYLKMTPAPITQATEATILNIAAQKEAAIFS